MKQAPVRTYLNYVGGQWKPAQEGATVERSSPADTRVSAGIFQSSTASDVNEAVAAAKEAYPRWSCVSLSEREGFLYTAADRLLARRDEIARTMALEMGKPVKESMAEVIRASQIVRFFAGELRRPIGEVFNPQSPSSFLYTMREPVGVVALITPWNFPVAIPIWKVAPALAFGNTVVLKPASDAAGSSLLIAECFEEAGLPSGVFNVITGSGSVAGQSLVQHETVTAISFTGSEAVGNAVRRSAGPGVRVQLELGGQNPAVVLRDANLDLASAAIIAGAFGGSGQKCTATRRAIIHSSLIDELGERLTSLATVLQVGDPFSDATDLGPLVNATAVEAFETAIARAQSEGGQILTGGGRPDAATTSPGHYVEPTTISSVQPGTHLACEEVFGPALALMSFSSFEEAVALSNDVRHGLAAAVFTRDLDLARRFAREIRAGVVHINSQTAGAEAHVPFGGLKQSGFGPHEQGRAAMEFFTEVKTVYEDPAG